MCVLAFAWSVDDRWPLVLIGNRDEHHARPTAALSRWEGEAIIAGRDLLSGGTWLGVSDKGLAVVTNVSTGRPATGLSRGMLVPDYLRGTGPARGGVILEGLNPFNLLTFDDRDAQFISNYPVPVQRSLDPGLYALANGELDQRLFRTDRLRAALADWLAGDREHPETLLTALGPVDPDPGKDGPADDEGAPIPVFIRNPVYGTRCSTVTAVDAQGRGLIIERRFDTDGSVTGETRLDFAWRS